MIQQELFSLLSLTKRKLIPFCLPKIPSRMIYSDLKSSISYHILDLTDLAAWADLPSIWKHIYYLPTGGIFAVLCRLKELASMSPIHCTWYFGVEVVGMLWFFSFGVSQDCMLSLFVMFKSFWMVFWEDKTGSVFSLSMIEETKVLVESIKDGVW